MGFGVQGCHLNAGEGLEQNVETTVLPWAIWDCVRLYNLGLIPHHLSPGALRVL